MTRNWRQRKRRNIGNKARQRLPILMKNFNNKCYWCGKEIVMMRSILKEYVLDIDHGSITYKNGEEVVQKLLASVDHKVGLVDGGNNQFDNLVPSCRYCNEGRGRQREIELGYAGLLNN